MKINLKKLNQFLYDANAKGYAGGGKEIKAQRLGFKEIEYKSGDWYYRDSYSGFFFAPGQEIIYLKRKPIWAMAYSGGMKEKYHGDAEFAGETFGFLKKALMAMDRKKPFRGPEKLEEDDYRYESKIVGDIKDFIGKEKIFYKNKIVFEQNFIGGLIISK